MNDCLRCGKACGTALFCHFCQTALLHRSQQEESPSLSSRTSYVQVTDSEAREVVSSIQTPSWSITPAKEGDATLLENATGDSDNEQEENICRTSQIGRVVVSTSEETPAGESEGLWRRIRIKHARRLFVLLTILAVVALIVDCVLVSLVFTQQSKKNQATRTEPMVTFTPSLVYPGQLARLRLRQFSPSARVLLRRNIDEAIRLETGTSYIQVNEQGEAEVQVLIEDSWESGSHSIEAEDIEARFVASVAIQVIGAAPARPPQLQVDQEQLDLGTDLQGANTIQPLTLHNAGDGRLSWTAWTDQPWLMLTPTQGAFSTNQRVMIAASRASLQPGSYEGTVTFVSSAGANITVTVTMEVVPTRADTRPVLVITPPALSFTAADGGPEPQEQFLTVSNPGSQTLYWSFGQSSPTISVDQGLPLTQKMDWLEVHPRSGEVKPGASSSIRLRVRSQTLLPSVYSGMLSFTGGEHTLNTPQAVAVSLMVQPRCGITTGTGLMSFTMPAGQQQMKQTLSLGLASECREGLHWRASSLTEWLTVTPNSGKLVERSGALTTVTIDGTGLKSGTHQGFLVFLSERRSQTVMVELIMLVPGQMGEHEKQDTNQPGTASPGTTEATTNAPILTLSSTALTFEMVQGQTKPAPQGVTVTNTGGNLLYWQARSDPTAPSWLGLSTLSGITPAGETSELGIQIDGQALPPGTYRTTVVITASDGAGVQVSGSPQTLMITVKVAQPCTLHITPNHLSFQASLLNPHPPAQNITIESIGNCAYPVTWNALVDGESQSWLYIAEISGRDSGNGSVVAVHVNASGKLLGSNRGQITFSAVDTNGASLRNSSQTVNVTLTPLG